MIYVGIKNGRQLKYTMSSFYEFIFHLVYQHITLTPQKMLSATRTYCLTTLMRKFMLLLHDTR
jgi:hypothetical protein